MLNMNHPRQRGIHITGRETAEMRGCHRDDGGPKKKEAPRTAYCASASPKRGKEFPVASEGMGEKVERTGTIKEEVAWTLPRARKGE